MQKQAHFDCKVVFVGVTAYMCEFQSAEGLASSYIRFDEQHLWSLKPKEVTLNLNQFNELAGKAIKHAKDATYENATAVDFLRKSLFEEKGQADG